MTRYLIVESGRAASIHTAPLLALQAFATPTDAQRHIDKHKLTRCQVVAEEQVSQRRWLNDEETTGLNRAIVR